MIEVRNNPYNSQAALSEKLNISPAMTSKYISSLISRDLLHVSKNKLKGNYYSLSALGTEYLNNLMNQYLQEINILKDLFYSHATYFQKEYELKIAVTTAFGSLLPYIADKLGFFEKNQMKITLVEYSNGEKLMEDFENKNFDMALLGSVPAYLWKIYGAPINIFATVDSGGHAIIAQEKIQNISDLKGKKIIIPGRTTVTNNVFRIFIKNNPEFNIDYDRDIYIENIPIERIPFLLESNKADAIILWEPYVSMFLRINKKYKLLYDLNSISNSYMSNVLVINKEFNDIYSETVKRFINVLSITIEYYKNNTNKIDKMIGEKLQLSESVIKEARSRVNFEIIEIDK